MARHDVTPEMNDVVRRAQEDEDAHGQRNIGARQAAVIFKQRQVNT
jgi:hypothetical protein